MRRIGLIVLAALGGLLGALFVTAPPSSAAAGSDTDGGYRYLDSDEPGGPVYDRLVPSNSAGFTSNTQTKTMSMGFAVEFYGVLYAVVTVNEDGALLLGADRPDVGLLNLPLDDPATEQRAIYPLWDNWNIHANPDSQVYYETFGTTPNRVFVVEWRNVHTEMAGGDTVTFQVQIRQSDDSIELHYTDVITADPAFTRGAGATIGIDDRDASELEYSFNRSSVRNQFAIRFWQPVCGGRKATIVGTPRRDDLVGTAGGDVIVGLGGDDRIRGNEGSDVICGGGGNDELRGGSGADFVYGGNGDDQLVGGTAGDVLRGQGDDDTIVGLGGPDLIHGDTGADTIDAGGHNDTVWGGGGNDLIIGGGGRDTLRGQAGADVIRGGAGNDTIEAGTGHDVGGTGGPGADTVIGGPGNDVLNGGLDDDTVRGNAGADTLRGAGGDDLLVGGAADDTLLGGTGADRLVGGPATDVCNGGNDGGMADTAVGCESLVNIP